MEEGVKDLVAPLQRPLQLTEMACQLQQLTEEVKQLRLYQTHTRKTAPRWSSHNRPPPPPPPPVLCVGTVEDRDIFNRTVLTVGQNLGIIKTMEPTRIPILLTRSTLL